jgi:hypothetical protein
MCRRWTILALRESARGVTILISCSVSSSETGVKNGLKTWKAHLPLSAEQQKAIYCGLEFSNK